MIRQSSSTGPCKYLHNYYKKNYVEFLQKRGEKNYRILYNFKNVALCLFPISSLGKVLYWLFQTDFFSFGRQKKWSLVASGRWSSYTVTILWEFAWVDSVLVVLGGWSYYGGGHLNRFDCTRFVIFKLFLKRSKGLTLTCETNIKETWII